MNRGIPVVFSGGRAGCLSLSIPQAAKYNKDIWLLKNDGDIFDYRGILGDERQFFWSRLSDNYSEIFEKYYVHYSPNPPEFEKQCFIRYIVLYEFMKSKGFDRALLAEHDVMTFTDYGAFFGNTGTGVKVGVSFSVPVQSLDTYGSLAWSGHSYWTVDALKDYIEFLIDLYMYPESGVGKSSKQGICDMTLTKLWVKHNDGKGILNMAPVSGNNVFDYNLCQKTDYEGENFRFHEILRLKKWVMKDGLPYFIAEDGREIRALTMHFNGQSKGLMKSFIETGGDLKKMLRTPEGREYRASCHRQFRNRIINGIRRRLP